MHVDEDRPTSEQLDASWDETFERLRSFIACTGARRRRCRRHRPGRARAQHRRRRPANASTTRRPGCTGQRATPSSTTTAPATSTNRSGQIAELWPEPEPADDRPNDATRDLAGCLQPLVAQLPEIYREALDRVDLAGQSHHVAAAEVGISTSGMKSRVQRARRQLKELLTDCCAVQVDRLGAVASYHPNTGTCGCPGRD